MSFIADLLGVMWRHPVLSCLSLLLFTPPFYPVVRFFSPLLISTAVFVVVVVSIGPALEHRAAAHAEGQGRRRRVAAAADNSTGFWNEHRKPPQGEETSWVWGLLQSMKNSAQAWIENKFRNEEMLQRLGNEGEVRLVAEESGTTSSRGGSSRKSSLKSKSSSDMDSSSRRAREVGAAGGNVLEARAVGKDDSDEEEESMRRSRSTRLRNQRSSNSRSNSRNSFKYEADSDMDSEEDTRLQAEAAAAARRARSKSLSKPLPKSSRSNSRQNSRPNSRSNSRKGFRYDGDADLDTDARLQGEGSAKHGTSRSSSGKSFKPDKDSSSEQEDGPVSLQVEAAARSARSMSASRSLRSNSAKGFTYDSELDLDTEEDSRLQAEALASHSRSSSRSRPRKGHKVQDVEDISDGDGEPKLVARRPSSRSHSSRGLKVSSSSSEEEPKLVARRPSSRSLSRPRVVPAGAADGEEDDDAGVTVSRQLSSSRGPVSRSDSGNGIQQAHSEADGSKQDSMTDGDQKHARRPAPKSGAGSASRKSVSRHLSSTRSKSARSRSESEPSVSSEGDAPDADADMRAPGSYSAKNEFSYARKLSADADTMEDDKRSGRHRSSSESDPESSRKPSFRSVSGKRASAAATAIVAPAGPTSEEIYKSLLSRGASSATFGTVAAASEEKARDSSEDEGLRSDFSSSESEVFNFVPPPPVKGAGAGAALPGRLVRKLSRELKGYIDEKLVPGSDAPEAKVEKLHTLHTEISGILNNFSIHEEEEKLASVLGGLSAFLHTEPDQPHAELIPKRWTSKNYEQVDILPQTPSVKRLADRGARDSQKLEMLKLYGHLLAEKEEQLTRQDQVGSSREPASSSAIARPRAD